MPGGRRFPIRGCLGAEGTASEHCRERQRCRGVRAVDRKSSDQMRGRKEVPTQRALRSQKAARKLFLFRGARWPPWAKRASGRFLPFFPAYFTAYTSAERVNENLQRFTKCATLPYLLASFLYGYNNGFTAIYANPIIRSPSSPPKRKVPVWVLFVLHISQGIERERE